MALKLLYRLYFYPHFRLRSMDLGDAFRCPLKWIFYFRHLSYIVFASHFEYISVRHIKIVIAIKRKCQPPLTIFLTTRKWFCWYYTINIHGRLNRFCLTINHLIFFFFWGGFLLVASIMASFLSFFRIINFRVVTCLVIFWLTCIDCCRIIKWLDNE